MLSKHAIETNHRLGSSEMVSQHMQQRQAILAYTATFALYNCIKKAVKAQNSRQAARVK